MRGARDTLPSLWRVGGNGADLPSLQEKTAWRRTSVLLAREAGSSHRPQEASTLGRAILVAEGGQQFGVWTTTGRVGYERRLEERVQWRHVSDAYEGLHYIWADSVGGDVRRDVLSLGTTVASPVWRGLRLALGVDYGLGQGARQTDPRPLFRRRVAELLPALRYSHGAHRVGVAYGSLWQREDLEIGGGTSADYPVLFRLRGIATFDRTQLISGERAMIGAGHATSIAYAHEGARWLVGTSGGIRRTTVVVRDGIAAPVTGGTSRSARYDARFVARRVARHAIEGDVQVTHEEARGTDPVFAADNAVDRGWRVPVRLTWWGAARGDSAAWSLAATVTMAGLTRRDVATASQWSVTSWRPGLGAMHRLRRTSPWLIAVDAAAVRISSASIATPFPTRTSALLAVDDARLLQTPRWMTSAAVAYEFRDQAAIRGTVRLGVSTMQHSTLQLTDRRARGREHWTLSWELL